MARPAPRAQRPQPAAPRGQRPQQVKKQSSREDRVLTLYYWAPGRANWGHVSLKLSDGTYMSWWPSGADKRYQGLVPAAIVADWVSPVRDNTLARDTQDEGYEPAKLLIPHGFLNEDDMKTWWQRHEQNNGYNGIRLNCSTTCYLALKHGGANTFCADPGNWYWTPDRCLQYTRVMKAKMMEKEFKQAGSVRFEALTQAQSQQLERLKLTADQKAAQLRNRPLF